MDQVSNTLSHLINSNFPPQPFEVPSIQHELNKLNEAIDDLQIQLRKLEQERQTYQGLLSPLRRMPLELLGEIFSFALSPENVEQNRRDDNLITLSLVSRGWRDGALEAHQLWGDLEVFPEHCWTPRMFEKINHWLTRSKNYPRSLKLYVPDHDPLCTTSNECLPSIPQGPLAALLTDGPVVQKLSLSFPRGQCFRNLTITMERIKQGMPTPSWDSLRSLDLEFREWRYMRSFNLGEMKLDDTFSRVPPAITSFGLRLPGVDPSDFHFLPELNWPTPCLWIPQPLIHLLTTLRFELNGEATSALMVLRDCTNLETLVFDFERYSFQCKSIPESILLRINGISLPKLRTLRLEHAAACDVENFLRIFRMPSLSELDLSFKPVMGAFSECEVEEAPEELASNIVSFVERSKCRLLHFRIHYLSFRSENSYMFILKTILSNLPTLTHLTLDTVTFDGQDLWLSDNATPLLPRLEVLELLNIPLLIPIFNPSMIAEFIEARYPDKLQSKDSLRKFVLTYEKPVELEDSEHPRHPDQLEGELSAYRLRRFQGMEVSFGFS